MASILEWLRTASLGEIGGAVFLIYYGLKGLARITPTEADDNFLAQVGAALNWISRALRFDPPKNPIEIPPEALDRLKAATDNIEALANLGDRVGQVVKLDGNASAQAAAAARFERRSNRRRAIIRAKLRELAEDDGLDKLSDAQLDVATEEIAAMAGGLDILLWILMNGPTVVALLKALLNIKAEELA